MVDYTVLLQHDNYGFSDPVVFRSKAQCEGNGPVFIQFGLVEHWNAAAGHLRVALRVSLSTPTDCVAPLDKGLAIACDSRLGTPLRCSCIALLPSIHGHIAVNVDKLTELAHSY